MPDQFVYIKHDDVATLGGPVTKQALDEIYSKNDWRAATEEEVREHEYNLAFRIRRSETLTPEDVDAVAGEAETLTAEDVDAAAAKRKRDELDQIALDRGIDPTEYPTPQALAEAVKATIEQPTG